LASIFSGVSDLQGVKISVFPLTLLVIVTTVLPLPRSLWFVCLRDCYTLRAYWLTCQSCICTAMDATVSSSNSNTTIICSVPQKSGSGFVETKNYHSSVTYQVTWWKPKLRTWQAALLELSYTLHKYNVKHHHSTPRHSGQHDISHVMTRSSTSTLQHSTTSVAALAYNSTAAHNLIENANEFIIERKSHNTLSLSHRPV